MGGLAVWSPRVSSARQGPAGCAPCDGSRAPSRRARCRQGLLRRAHGPPTEVGNKAALWARGGTSRPPNPQRQLPSRVGTAAWGLAVVRGPHLLRAWAPSIRVEPGACRPPGVCWAGRTPCPRPGSLCAMEPSSSLSGGRSQGRGQRPRASPGLSQGWPPPAQDGRAGERLESAAFEAPRKGPCDVPGSLGSRAEAALVLGAAGALVRDREAGVSFPRRLRAPGPGRMGVPALGQVPPVTACPLSVRLRRGQRGQPHSVASLWGFLSRKVGAEEGLAVPPTLWGRHPAVPPFHGSENTSHPRARGSQPSRTLCLLQEAASRGSG